MIEGVERETRSGTDAHGSSIRRIPNLLIFIHSFISSKTHPKKLPIGLAALTLRRDDVAAVVQTMLGKTEYEVPHPRQCAPLLHGALLH